MATSPVVLRKCWHVSWINPFLRDRQWVFSTIDPLSNVGRTAEVYHMKLTLNIFTSRQETIGSKRVAWTITCRHHWQARWQKNFVESQPRVIDLDLRANPSNDGTCKDSYQSRSWSLTYQALTKSRWKWHLQQSGRAINSPLVATIKCDRDIVYDPACKKRSNCTMEADGTFLSVAVGAWYLDECMLAALTSTLQGASQESSNMCPIWTLRSRPKGNSCVRNLTGCFEIKKERSPGAELKQFNWTQRELGFFYNYSFASLGGWTTNEGI